MAGMQDILVSNFYATDYGSAFVPPVVPRDYPHLPAAATSWQKCEASEWHKQDLLEYWEYGAAMVCCHNQLQKAIHEDYLAELEDACLGLAKIMPKEIFDHIISCYTKITIPMWNKNWREFKQPMDPNKPFVVYTKWQEKCQSFAANAKKPIREATMITSCTSLPPASWLQLIANGNVSLTSKKRGPNVRNTSMRRSVSSRNSLRSPPEAQALEPMPWSSPLSHWQDLGCLG